MPFFAIIALSIGAAVFYGLIHDQITARLCIEYFTVAHPQVVVSDSPTVQGLVWGVIATWWAGSLIGLPLAVVARAGKCTPWTARQLLKPIGVLLGAMALCALISGGLGYFLAETGRVNISPFWADSIPPAHHHRFIAAAWAHNASYLSGFMGGLVLCVWLWTRRCGPALKAALR